MNKSYNLVVIPFGLGIIGVTTMEFTEDAPDGNKYAIAITSIKDNPGVVGEYTGIQLTDEELFEEKPILLTFPTEEHRDKVLNAIFNRS